MGTVVAVISPTRHRHPVGPGRRWAWPVGREVTLLAVGLLAYRAVRFAVRDDVADALDNADRVVAWERAVGIFNEVHLQTAVLDLDALVWALNRYYFFGHFLGTAAVVVWLFVRHHDHYGRVRRVLLVTSFSALALHVAFPLAPPRWFPDMGFVDTLQTYGPRVYDSETVTSTANQIAAMPSLHVGWALIVAWAVVRASTRPWRLVAVVHPVIMTAAVVLTANHWWLDAVVAAGLVASVVALDAPVQRWLAERRPPDGAAGSEDRIDRPHDAVTDRTDVSA